TARGSHETFEDVLRETLFRDSVDSSRDAAPLHAASDAIRIDTDHLSIDNVVASIESLARAQLMPCGSPVWPPSR
ncbi:MAG: (d)CMP kinase, partial [Chloroflexia bacterium]|nr:(d)CMP kinase [Chloroflexia bacterium]